MFSLKHIIILSICLVFIVSSLFILKKYKPSIKTTTRILLVIGVVTEALKMCAYIVSNEEKYGGYLPKGDLPFHLCSIQIIFLLLMVLIDSEKLRRTLLAFMLPSCLIGGIAALIIATSSSLNMPVITVQYFLYHSSIIVFAIYLYMTDEIVFNIKDYKNTLLMLLGIFFLAIYLNSWINDYQNAINFMYVVNPPQSGLPFLNKDKGWLIYILRYAFICVVAVTLCYIVPIINAIKDKKHQ